MLHLYSNWKVLLKQITYQYSDFIISVKVAILLLLLLLLNNNIIVPQHGYIVQAIFVSELITRS